MHDFILLHLYVDILTKQQNHYCIACSSKCKLSESCNNVIFIIHFRKHVFFLMVPEINFGWHFDGPKRMQYRGKKCVIHE